MTNLWSSTSTLQRLVTYPRYILHQSCSVQKYVTSSVRTKFIPIPVCLCTIINFAYYRLGMHFSNQVIFKMMSEFRLLNFKSVPVNWFFFLFLAHSFTYLHAFSCSSKNKRKHEPFSETLRRNLGEVVWYSLLMKPLVYDQWFSMFN